MGDYYPHPTNPAGIDYSGGLPNERGEQVNIDTKTGIRYGVIHENRVSGDALNDVEYDYPPAACGDCGTELVECPNNDDLKICPTCYAAYDDNDISDNCGESVGWHVDEGPKLRVTSSGDGDMFVIESEYVSYGKFCSPCAPGAVYLANPLPPDVGVKAYCLGPDWFDKYSPCPYDIYRADTGELVQKRQESEDEDVAD